MRPRIFISCVTKEFGGTRQRVVRILNRCGYDPVWQDIFGTEPGDMCDMLRRKIDDCDGLIQIVGWGYGFEPPAWDADFGRVSYTQFEFHHARRSNKKTWLIFPGPRCTRDTPRDRLDLPADPKHPNPSIWRAERRALQKKYCRRLEATGHIRHKPPSDAELELMVERLHDEFAQLRSAARLRRVVVLALLAIIISLLVPVFLVTRESAKANREILSKLDKAEKRDASSSELLGEFRQLLAARSFSAQRSGPAENVSIVVGELAREHGLTEDLLRQRILQAEPGARERIELAERFRSASESDATRMKQIARGGHEDIATAAMISQHYDQALEHFQQAIVLTSKDEELQEWAGLQFALGVCHFELSARVEGPPANQHLRDTVASYREALKVWTLQQMPQEWAAAQNNLGIALSEQAARSEGMQADQALIDSLAAYREALKVHTREAMPQAWAITQNNLGNALGEQAARSEGVQASQLMTEAVAAIREVIEAQMREQAPQIWAMTQNNLAGALSQQVAWSEGAQAAQLLREAVMKVTPTFIGMLTSV